ncbi:MAG TPA: transcription termination/antitermination NusG family protein [Thiopseudomonas sp.]|nr:transcription termination/antitermination NusG family protein [Thiopseudomonas sp.]
MTSTHTTNSTTAWYVVLTKPRQEQRAKENLERQGGEVYLPLFSNERIVRGKRVKREEPLFLGYLFLNIPTNSPLLSKVRSTFGVRQHFTGSLSGLSGDI